MPTNNQLYIVLDNIRSAHNVGAIFRTADGAGVTKIFLCGITATPPHKEITKTALGTIDNVPWEYYEKTVDAIKALKEQGIQVIALEQTEQSVNFKEFKYNNAVTIVAGNEIDGVSPEVLDICDGIVDIPMRGVAKSLNVATSTGIMLYHIND